MSRTHVTLLRTRLSLMRPSTTTRGCRETLEDAQQTLYVPSTYAHRHHPEKSFEIYSIDAEIAFRSPRSTSLLLTLIWYAGT